MASAPLAVLDANVLLNLATPVVDGRDRAPSGDDPLRTVLGAYDVHVPDAVLGEVAEASGGDDLLAAAADAVLRASAHLTAHDVAAEAATPLEYGLDRGETRAVWLANDLNADLLVTDEFGSTNLALIALELDDADSLYTTPHVLCALAAEGVLHEAYVATLLEYLRDRKHWDRAYVSRLRSKYLEE